MRLAIGEGEDDMQAADGATDTYRVYGYRWVVLAVFMLANLAIQMLWISYAPITSQAARYYGVSSLAIGILAMTFMIAFIPLVAAGRLGDRHAWLPSRRGFRRRADGRLRRRAWPGRDELHAGAAQHDRPCRRPAVPAGRMDQGPGQLVRPGRARHGRRSGHARQHARHRGGHGAHADPGQRHVDRHASSSSTVCSRPSRRSRSSCWRASGRRRRPARPGMDERALMLDGLKHALTVKPFLVMLGVAFIVMSAFNGVTTWVEEIIKPRGFTRPRRASWGA